MQTPTKRDEPEPAKLKYIHESFIKKNFTDTQDYIHSILPDYPNSALLFNVLGLIDYNFKNFESAKQKYCKAIELNPNFPDPLNNLGMVERLLGNYQDAVSAFKRSIIIKPDYVEAFFNLANLYLQISNLPEAEINYKHALRINPNFTQASQNLGATLIKMKRKADAADIYMAALEFSPLNDAVLLSLGGVFKDMGELQKSINCYEKIRKNKNDHVESFTRWMSIKVQLGDFSSINNALIFHVSSSLARELENYPRFQIYKSILDFLVRDLASCRYHLEKFSYLRQIGETSSLSKKNLQFCNAFYDILTLLVKKLSANDLKSDNKVFHFGESHCLSFAHCSIKNNNFQTYLTPVITFGAKAFHFSTTENNNFKAITLQNLNRIPRNSDVFLSFGEIDCRLNEGIIEAQKKTNKKITSLVESTVYGYVQWFLDSNTKNNHSFWFFNVPAPVFRNDRSSVDNRAVAEVVTLFNETLAAILEKNQLRLIDVYSGTNNNLGFSNLKHHIDGIHLGHSIITEIEHQFFT
jgi:tetratricopeptide (TPR) repeat protein